MAKPKGVSLTAMLDSASEDESDHQLQHEMAKSMPSHPSISEENIAPVKKGRGRPPSKVTKPKVAASRRTSGSTVRVAKGGKPALPAKKAATAGKKGGRMALKEQENEERPQSETEEVDEFDGQQGGAAEDVMSEDELSTPTKAPVSKKGAKGVTKSKLVSVLDVEPTKNAASSRPVAAVQDQAEDTVEASKPAKRHGRGRPPKANPKSAVTALIAPHSEECIVPEDQMTAMDLDPAGEEPDTHALVLNPTLRPTAPARAASSSRSHPAPLPSRRRGNSASDNELPSTTDPVLRRKLGEATRALSTLDVKYRSLRDVGIKEADTNFSNLKRQSEAKTEAAERLIASLRADLASQTALAKESRAREKQLKQRDADIASLRAQTSSLNKKLDELQSENKILSTKLASTRSTAQHPSSSVPKGSVTSSSASAQAHIAQLKEELYSDLTGLILRDVKRKRDADVYDCIQTGRNGTLRFRLAISNASAASAFSTSTSKPPPPRYEETEFVFTPLFDGKNDQALVELLPDYLTEEITFARGNAGKFYGRVVEVLTRARSRDE